MTRCPKAKPGKQRKAHDEKRSKKPSAAWEALVGSFTRHEPNLANALEKILRAARPVILVDSGLSRQRARSTIRTTGCTELLGSATEALLMPTTVSAEICYLPEPGAGPGRRRYIATAALRSSRPSGGCSLIVTRSRPRRCSPADWVVQRQQTVGSPCV
jgi:hypothetical protein